MKRQFHIVPPWGSSGSDGTNATLLLEIPATEPFAHSISFLSPELIHVVIRAGKASEESTRWCATYLFVCTPGGVADYTFRGEEELRPEEDDGDPSFVGLLDWQEWAYYREIEPLQATDTFSRSYQRAYLPIEPPLDVEEDGYFGFKPQTTGASRVVTSVAEQTSGTRDVFDFNNSERDRLSTAVKSRSGSVLGSGVRKSPTASPTAKSGATIELKGLPVGWTSARITNSNMRVLAFSGYYE